MRLISTLPLLALLALTALPASARTELGVGDVAPAFEAVDPDGAPIKLDDYAGRVLVVNFWASWCSPCMRELPHLDAMHARLAADGGAVLALNVDRSRGPALGAIKQLELKLPVALDPRQRVVEVYRPMVLPATYVVDRTGIVRIVRNGEIEEADVPALEAEVRKLLGEH